MHSPALRKIQVTDKHTHMHAHAHTHTRTHTHTPIVLVCAVLSITYGAIGALSLNRTRIKQLSAYRKMGKFGGGKFWRSQLKTGRFLF